MSRYETGAIIRTELRNKHRRRHATSEPAMPTPFGDCLQQMLDDRQMSQAKLGRLAGTNHTHISRLIGGSRNPTRDSIAAIATALDLNPHRAARLALLAFVPDMPVLAEIMAERAVHSMPDDFDRADWMVALYGELAQVSVSVRDDDSDDSYRYGLIRLAALAIQAIEAMDASEQEDTP